MAKSHRIEIEDRDKQPNARAVIEWEIKPSSKGPRFSMTGEVSESRGGYPSQHSGQAVKEILELFGHLEHVSRLCDIWERWHLNDMHAGCEHQRAEKWSDRRIDPAQLPADCHANRDERGVLAVWVKWDEHVDGLLMRPCYVCGYEYGSQWLYEPLPDGLEADLETLGKEAAEFNKASAALCPGDRPGPRTMADRLTEYGLKVSVEREESRPDGFGENDMHRHFRCIVTRKGSRARYLCHFSQGSAHTEDPTPEDVISALISDADGIRDGFERWAAELGYDTDSRKAERIFKACEKTAAGLRRLLSDAEIEALTYETERD